MAVEGLRVERINMKPIIFNTEAVRAIQDGRKTVTRRVLKPHNAVKANKLDYFQGNGLWYNDTIDNLDRDAHIKDCSVSPCWITTKAYIQKYAPYKAGDILYVQETWCKLTDWEDQYPDSEEELMITYYKADYQKDEWDMAEWRPSIRMPKEAARIFLQATGVHVERLQDITEGQAIREGCNGVFCGSGANMGDGWGITPIDEYKPLWNSTVKESDLAKYDWEVNPWVWVIEFDRISKEEANGKENRT